MENLNNWDEETLAYVKTIIREWQAETARREDELIPKLRAGDKLALYKARELRAEWTAYSNALGLFRNMLDDNSEATEAEKERKN